MSQPRAMALIVVGLTLALTACGSSGGAAPSGDGSASSDETTPTASSSASASASDATATSPAALTGADDPVTGLTGTATEGSCAWLSAEQVAAIAGTTPDQVPEGVLGTGEGTSSLGTTLRRQCGVTVGDVVVSVSSVKPTDGQTIADYVAAMEATTLPEGSTRTPLSGLPGPAYYSTDVYDLGGGQKFQLSAWAKRSEDYVSVRLGGPLGEGPVPDRQEALVTALTDILQ